MSYPWTKYLTAPSWDEFDDFSYFDSDDFRQVVKNWWEKEKTLAETKGGLQALQQAAYVAEIQKEKEEKIGKNGKSIKYIWLTVNPDPANPLISPENPAPFMQIIDKLISKKWITNALWVYEIGGTGLMHSHILIKPDENKPAHKMFPECQNTVQHVCLTTNTHCFNFVRLTEEDQAIEKFNYLMGFKCKEKQEAVHETNKWREKHNIKPYYVKVEGRPILLDPRKQQELLSNSAASVSEKNDEISIEPLL